MLTAVFLNVAWNFAGRHFGGMVYVSRKALENIGALTVKRKA